MDRKELEAECNEQARLNGMGAEREARLMAEVERLRKLVQEQDTMLGRKPCAGTNADGNPRCHVLADVRRERDAIVGALGNEQIAAFIEKHGNPVPLIAELEAVKAERDALAKDAARYRWLCDGGMYRVGFDSIGNVSLDMLDATIDAAMAEGER